MKAEVLSQMLSAIDIADYTVMAGSAEVDTIEIDDDDKTVTLK